MVIGCWFQTKYYFLQSMLSFKNIWLKTEILKTLFCIIDNKTSRQGPACWHTAEGMMAVFVNVNTYHQMFP
jgi:hypothetical protein